MYKYKCIGRIKSVTLPEGVSLSCGSGRFNLDCEGKTTKTPGKIVRLETALVEWVDELWPTGGTIRRLFAFIQLEDGRWFMQQDPTDLAKGATLLGAEASRYQIEAYGYGEDVQRYLPVTVEV